MNKNGSIGTRTFTKTCITHGRDGVCRVCVEQTLSHSGAETHTHTHTRAPIVALSQPYPVLCTRVVHHTHTPTYVIPLPSRLDNHWEVEILLLLTTAWEHISCLFCQLYTHTHLIRNNLGLLCWQSSRPPVTSISCCLTGHVAIRKSNVSQQQQLGILLPYSCLAQSIHLISNPPPVLIKCSFRQTCVALILV